MGRERQWLALLAVIVVAGCTGGGTHKANGPAHGSGTTTSTGPAVKVAWSRPDIKAVSQPVVAGGNFIVYAGGDKGLEVLALDPATGKTVWQATAANSTITPGESPQLGVFDTLVTFFEPPTIETAFLPAVAAQAGDDQTARLVGVDGATGKVVWTGKPALFSDWPQPCIDDSTAVCTTGLATNASASRLLRFKAATGAALAAPAISTTDISRQLGPDLFDPGSRSPEELVATDGALVTWHKTLASIFPGKGYSTDNGWDFDRIPAVGLFVGSVFGPPASTTASKTVVDLSQAATAGFKINTGVTMWREAGSTYLCGPLPCPGMTQTASGTTTYSPPTSGLRLRMTGTETFSDSGKPVLSPTTKIVVEGFDLATGHTTWSINAGRNEALAQAMPPPQIGDETVILPDSSGQPSAVNLSTGTQTPVPAGAIAFCVTETTYTGAPHDNGSGGTSTDYDGGAAEFPCHATVQGGGAVATPARVPAFVGPSLGGVIAWSESDQVVAAPAAG